MIMSYMHCLRKSINFVNIVVIQRPKNCRATQRAFTLKMFSLYYSYFPLHRKNRVASTTDTIAMPIKTAASKPYSVMGASVHVPRSN